MTDGDATVILPLSGFVLQWRRRDRSFRVAARDDVEATDDAGTELGWEQVSGQPSVRGRGQRAHRAGEDPGESWWIAYGEFAGTAVVVVELADGTRPPVHTAGRAWAAEWVCIPTPAVVTVGGQVVDRLLFDRPVHY